MASHPATKRDIMIKDKEFIKWNALPFLPLTASGCAIAIAIAPI
jgi:hypothetical protein